MVTHDSVNEVLKYGALTTVDGGTKHLGETAKVTVVGVLVATAGLSAVGREELFGDSETH